MEKKKKLPVGIEDFGKIRAEGFYYIDKTNLIEDLMEKWGEVNLFTRPRRCGKAVFDGLMCADTAELCERYMGQFPVISISM